MAFTREAALSARAHTVYAIFSRLRFTLFMHEHDDNAIIFY